MIPLIMGIVTLIFVYSGILEIPSQSGYTTNTFQSGYAINTFQMVIPQIPSKMVMP